MKDENKNKELFNDNNVLINKSLFVDLERVLREVINILKKREIDLEQDYEEVIRNDFQNELVAAKIKVVDILYQKNLITYNQAMELFTDIMVSQLIRNKLNQDTTFPLIDQTKETFELFEGKCLDIMTALNEGLITTSKFKEEYLMMYKYETEYTNAMISLLKHFKENSDSLKGDR